MRMRKMRNLEPRMAACAAYRIENAAAHQVHKCHKKNTENILTIHKSPPFPTNIVQERGGNVKLGEKHLFRTLQGSFRDIGTADDAGQFLLSAFYIQRYHGGIGTAIPLGFGD